MQGTADVVEYLGNEELLHVTVDGHEVVAIVDSSHRVRPGDVVQLRLPADKLHLFTTRLRALDRPAARGGRRLTSPSIRESGGRRVLGRPAASCPGGSR